MTVSTYITMQKNIVILGAGFGGVRCALDLAGKVPHDWKVILVDRNAYHLYYPRLYEEVIPHVSRNTYHVTRKCAVDVNEILKGTRVEFAQGEVQGIDCKTKTVVISTKRLDGARGEISTARNTYGKEISRLRPPASARDDENFSLAYDYLVLAFGADADYFGIPGLKEYACTLKSLEDAEMIRERVGEFLRVHNPPRPPSTPRERETPFSIVIGGAGATGVEVAAELAYLFRKIPQERWSITLVEALSHVLWMFPPAVGRYAHKRLEELGVKLMLDTCIKEVLGGERGVEVVLAPRPLKPGEKESELACDFLPEHEKRVAADILLWAGGVRANTLIAQCGIPTDRKGRVEVDEHLVVKGMEGVFAIGDNAALTDPTSKQPVPAIAQAALLEGKIAAENIARAIRGQPLALYPFPQFPAIVPLGRRDGVALLGNRVLCGLPAWLLRQMADGRYFASIVGWRKALKRCIL